MVPRLALICRCFAAGCAFFAARGGWAQLAAKSPFIPPQAAGSASPTAGAPLEFRGYIETSEGVQYRIFDPAKKTYTWVKLNEKNPEFEVTAKQHDPEHKTLTIDHQGKTLTLAMREAKVVSSGTAGQAIPPPPQPPAANVAPAVTQSVVLNPTPADEQRRLEAVAAEVARRRVLREQATQQIGQQPGQPAPATLPQPSQGFQSMPNPSSRGGPARGPIQNPPRQR
jgi:hypothetical protein